MKGQADLFRSRGEHDHSRVTYIELFFDLVFVFAITQLAHRLLAHLTIVGAVETLVLLFAVWWVWIYTSWVTNWLDPDCAPVRLMLIVMMLAGLVLSSAIPEAFGKTGWLFVGAYCAMQIGRSLYMVWAGWRVYPARARNFLRISFWFLLALPLWVGGIFAPHDARLLMWVAALAVEYAGPYLLFRTPGLGRSQMSDWDISGAHMAERCALFIIIALGESVLITGATFAQLPQDALHWTAFATCFLGSATLWWIYFDTGARRGGEVIAQSDNAGRIARNAYTYWHIPIVAGLVATAVGDELMLMHPHDLVTPAILFAIAGGPWLFLFGNLGFKWSTSGRRVPPFSQILGLILLAIIAAGAILARWDALQIGMAVFAALVLTAIWEWGSFHGGWQRWVPWLGRLLKWPTEGRM